MNQLTIRLYYNVFSCIECKYALKLLLNELSCHSACFVLKSDCEKVVKSYKKVSSCTCHLYVPKGTEPSTRELHVLQEFLKMEFCEILLYFINLN